MISYDDVLADTLATIDRMVQECDPAIYHLGCSQDDTVDSRGEKLRPYYNEGGEPYWM